MSSTRPVTGANSHSSQGQQQFPMSDAALTAELTKKLLAALNTATLADPNGPKHEVVIDLNSGPIGAAMAALSQPLAVDPAAAPAAEGETEATQKERALKLLSTPKVETKPLVDANRIKHSEQVQVFLNSSTHALITQLKKKWPISQYLCIWDLFCLEFYKNVKV